MNKYRYIGEDSTADTLDPGFDLSFFHSRTVLFILICLQYISGSSLTVLSVCNMFNQVEG